MAAWKCLEDPLFACQWIASACLVRAHLFSALVTAAHLLITRYHARDIQMLFVVVVAKPGASVAALQAPFAVEPTAAFGTLVEIFGLYNHLVILGVFRAAHRNSHLDPIEFTHGVDDAIPNCALFLTGFLLEKLEITNTVKRPFGSGKRYADSVRD